jgi:hypothetical protein
MASSLDGRRDIDLPVATVGDDLAYVLAACDLISFLHRLKRVGSQQVATLIDALKYVVPKQFIYK